MLKTPILLLVFNRPDKAQLVFNSIKATKPRFIYVAADGPRDHISGESDNCNMTRAVIEQIDWDCNVSKLFRESNLGCKKAVSSAITWFFNSVEEGIILEDDCLPNPSFFPFCEELLDRYRSDSRVMQICGSNLLRGWQRLPYSYYYSSYGPIWGWASWRRAWKYYDVDMKNWPRIKEEGILEDICLNGDEVAWRRDIYDKLFNGEIDTWDLQWGYSKMINYGLSITPNTNLISNIGFDSNASHTVNNADPYAKLPSREMIFPLLHPQNISRDRVSDKRFLDEFVLRITSR